MITLCYRLILIVVILGLPFGCTKSSGTCEPIHAKYEGYWAETLWTYDFEPNGNFIFRASGHYGNVVDSGTYLTGDNMIFLNPRSDWHVLAGVLKTRLKIIDSGCLRDFDSNYYCISIDDIDELSAKEFLFQDKVKTILDTTYLVRVEKERIEKRYKEPYIHIVYNGIIVIDGNEFHEFNLKSYTINVGAEVHLSFFSTKEPFDIFVREPVANKMNSILPDVN